MKPRILFLCTGNSARSQMAEGLMRATNGDRFEVFSAGIEPKGINPLAVEVMREIDIDISGQHSKNVTEFLGQPVQYVVTVCDSARQKCPIFPGTFKFLSWGLEDPAEATGSREQQLMVFRRIRDQIAERIKQEFPVHA